MTSRCECRVDAGGGSYEGEESAGAKNMPLTRRRKLRVHALAHDALQPDACGREGEGEEGERVRPGGLAPEAGDGALVALPGGDGGGHGEEGLDESG